MIKRILLCGTLLALASCDRTGPSQDAPTSAASPPVQVDVVEATAPDENPAVEPVAAQPNAPQTAASNTSQRISQQMPLLTPPPRSEKPRQVGVYTPPAGSVERVELMNALRNTVRGELGGEAVFVVNELRSNGQWAFAVLEPQWRDGSQIRMERTPIYRSNPDFPLDGLRTEAIWKKEGNRWRVYQHSIGSTDVWWLEHCDRVPRQILRGC